MPTLIASWNLRQSCNLTRGDIDIKEAAVDRVGRVNVSAALTLPHWVLPGAGNAVEDDVDRAFGRPDGAFF